MRRIVAMLRADWRSICRDMLLVITVFVPLFVAVFIRIVVPVATKELAAHASFDLSDHFIFIAGIAILMTPMMLGAMAGLQILDDRDQGILTYISVTPLTREGYVVWKLLTPVIIGCIITPIALLIMNIIPLKFEIIIPVTLLSAMGAPLYAIMLPAFAGNKVEGLAVAKASGVIMAAPFAGYLLPRTWSFIAGVLPPFWPTMAIVSGYRGDQSFWLYIAGGFIVNLAWTLFLKYKFSVRNG